MKFIPSFPAEYQQGIAIFAWLKVDNFMLAHQTRFEPRVSKGLPTDPSKSGGLGFTCNFHDQSNGLLASKSEMLPTNNLVGSMETPGTLTGINVTF